MNDTSAPKPGASQSKRQPQAFFTWLHELGVVRGDDAWVGGVCSAVAARTGLDPLIIRGIAVVMGILGGPVFLLYAIGWALLPDSRGTIHAERVYRGVWEAPSIAIIVLAAVTVLPVFRGIWWEGAPGVWGMPDWLSNTLGAGWALVLVAAGVWFAIWLARAVAANGGSFTGLKAPWDAHRGTSAPASSSTPPSPARGPQPFVAADERRSRAPEADPFGSDEPFSSTPPAAPDVPSSWRERGEASYTHPSGAGTRADDPVARAAAVRETARLEAERRTADRLALATKRSEIARRNAERSRDEAKVRAAERKERARLRKPGAAFTMIVLGLAALAGGITAVVAGSLAGSTLVAGGAAALAILGLGVVVAGIRGKSSGAIGDLAFLLVVVLLVAGVLPRDSQFQIIASDTWTVTAADASTLERHAYIAGGTTLDLSGLDPDGSGLGSGGDYEIYLVAGSVDIVMPKDERIALDVRSVVGGLDGVAQYSDRVSDGDGVFYSHSGSVGPGTSAPVATVTVWSVAGTVSVLESSD